MGDQANHTLSPSTFQLQVIICIMKQQNSQWLTKHSPPKMETLWLIQALPETWNLGNEDMP